MNDPDYTVELDCRGLKCPLPILKTRKFIETLNSGDILKMVATDPGSINDTTAWCRRTGNALVKHTEDNQVFIYYIRKK